MFRVWPRTDQRKSRRRQRGQALVEFALIVPIFLILLLGIVDFGMGLRTWIAVTNAAREGARAGAIGWHDGTFPDDCGGAGDETSIIGTTCRALAIGTDDVRDVSVDPVERNGVDGTQTGDSVVVSMTYSYDFITPLGMFIGGWTQSDCEGVDADLCMRSSADMRVE